MLFKFINCRLFVSTYITLSCRISLDFGTLVALNAYRKSRSHNYGFPSNSRFFKAKLFWFLKMFLDNVFGLFLLKSKCSESLKLNWIAMIVSMKFIFDFRYKNRKVSAHAHCSCKFVYMWIVVSDMFAGLCFSLERFGEKEKKLL